MGYTSKAWARTLQNLDPKKPRPYRTWTLKNLDPAELGSLKNRTLKNLDHEKRGKQLDVEKRLEGQRIYCI